MIKRVISVISAIILTTAFAIPTYAEDEYNWGEYSETTISSEEINPEEIWGENISPSENGNEQSYDNTEIKDGNAYSGAEWYYSLGGRLIRQGGRNSIDGKKCESKEETEALEQRIRNENYILISTDDKDITDEEYEKYMSSTTAPPYVNELNKTDFGWDMKMYRVYLYRPVFEQALQDIEKYDVIKSVTLSEIYESSVIIDYGFWYMKDKVGKPDNEFNNNIPSYCDTGFLQITSPVACEIIILNSYIQSYYTFYVKANTPFLVKVKQGEYYINKINGVKISTKEDLLPHTGIIWVQDENTEDNPFIIDLTGVIDKYEIQPQDISENEDLSWENRDNIIYKEIYENIPVQEVIVQEQEETEEPEDLLTTAINYAKWGLLICIILIVLILIGKNSFLKKEQ